MNINERLKLLRSSLNLSQEAFGEKIGIRSRAHISATECRNIEVFFCIVAFLFHTV